MKRAILTTFLWGGLFSLHAQNIVVIGEVKNVKEGTTFYMEETTGTGSTRFWSKDADEDNGKVIDGRFQLNYKCYNKDSRHFALYSGSPEYSTWVKLEFWANPGDTVYVKGNGPLLGNWDIKTDASEQKELDVIRKACVKELAAHQQAWLDYEAYRSYRRDTEMTETEWDSTGVILKQKDTLRTITKMALHKKQLEIMKQLPVTDFWMDYLVTILYDISPRRAEFEDIVKDIYMLHAGQIERKPDGRAVRDWVYPYPKAAIGKPCIDGDMYDVNGNKYHFSDFRGKYVLVDFWANYCGPCIASFPQLKKLQEIHADRLVVISLSIDKVPFWRTLSHHKDMTWLSLNDGGGNFGGLAGSYDVKALPTYILIAPDGTYKARLDASAIYNETLEKYLKDKI